MVQVSKEEVQEQKITDGKIVLDDVFSEKTGENVVGVGCSTFLMSGHGSKGDTPDLRLPLVHR